MRPSSVHARLVSMPFKHYSTRTHCCWSTRWAMRAATCGSYRVGRFAGLHWRHARQSKRSRDGCTRTSRVHPAEASDAAHRKGSDEDLRALTRMVIEPAASLLTGKRLVVVLAGSALADPVWRLAAALRQLLRAAPDAAPDLAPMLMRYEIVQVPSATILGAMRSLTAGRAAPSKTAAIFADPIYETQDPRVRPTASSVRPTRAPQPASAP